MHGLAQDLRFAMRALRRSPGFTVVALATLALGIGANTAIFSVVNAVLFRPLPFPQSDRLVAVFETNPTLGAAQTGVSYLNYADWTARVQSFSALAAVRMHDYALTGDGEPVLVPAGTVTSSLFRALGVEPLLGRGLQAADDAASAPPVAVIGEGLWRSRYAADPGIIGKSLLLDNRACTVVGVMPAAFQTPPQYPPAELWLPLAHDPVFPDLRQRRAGHYLRIVGRLKPGVELRRAEAELATIAGALARQYPKENEGWNVVLVPLTESLVGGVRTAMIVLLGAAGLVLLIACANVANLVLARATARSGEVAIRTALGAGRRRLVQQSLTESLLLALAGGALGLATAAATLRTLRAWLPSDLPRVGQIRLDASVLLFAFAVSVTASVVFGLVPALQTAGSNLAGALKEGSRGAGESRSRRRLRGLLVAGETALSLILLVGAGLLAQSLLRLQDVRLGFRPTRVLTAGISLPRAQYSSPDQWIGFYGRLVEGLRAEPEVEGAAAVLPLPLTGGGLSFTFTIEGRAPEKPGSDMGANYTALTPDYFRVLGVPLVRGRTFGPGDAAAAPKVCLVSAAFVRRYFPGEDPLGKRLVFGFKDSVPRQIVGVVGDVKRDGLAAPSQPEMYVPFEQDPWWAAYLAVRTRGDPNRLAAVLRAHVRALDPSLPLADVQPMTAIVADSVAQPRFRATLLGIFGLTALLLAAIGIYGVMSYDVSRQSREIGIRLALGAGAPDVLGLVLRQGLGLAAAGLLAGILGALVLTRFLSSLLFEMSPVDPATFAAVVLVLLAAAFLACWIPARRALRVSPAAVLRQD